MKKLFFLLVATLLVGCSTTPQPTALPIEKTPITRSESLLHTVVQLSVYHKNQEAAIQEALDYMSEMEKLFSTNLEGSDVYRINQAAGKEAVKVNDATFELIKKALNMANESHGKFDVSIGAVTNLWRIGDAEYANKPEHENIVKNLALINYKDITLDEANKTVKLEKSGMVIELGGISKGYIADGVKAIFEKHGITTAIINLGGNVVTMGTSPNNEKGWVVGVQDPDEVRGTVVGSVPVQQKAVVTSGIYERYVEVDGVKYHHILDPKTGYPVENNISGVTVITDNSATADGYSTVLFLLGIEEGLKYVDAHDNLEAVFIDKDGGIHLSKGLKSTFELLDKAYHIVE
ncbi:FAD:protein FMN transferase [Carnobacteriaceae bacterium zg-ZUI252]|nr:FAD:protein FMN transferase [Carnobacteriaceae bacterium zg-ZUI252]QTU82418.1 FAD:protein FMN transferase [Carnobacteriaceae bacterium zg-C25]